MAWFDGQGIIRKRLLSEKGSAFCPRPWREACREISLIAKRIWAYTSRTNGKAERFIKTRLPEGASTMAFQTSTNRDCWLARCLTI